MHEIDVLWALAANKRFGDVATDGHPHAIGRVILFVASQAVIIFHVRVLIWARSGIIRTLAPSLEIGAIPQICLRRELSTAIIRIPAVRLVIEVHTVVAARQTAMSEKREPHSKPVMWDAATATDTKERRCRSRRISQHIFRLLGVRASR